MEDTFCFKSCFHCYYSKYHYSQVTLFNYVRLILFYFFFGF
jgi:hypothetical protein